MITLSMISFVVGSALGQRFKIRVLVPAFAILVILAVAAGFTHARTAWSIALMVVTATTCLQVGYFGIGVLRHLLVAALSRRSAPLTSSTTPARHTAR
jgi:hypothetical protein